LEVDGFCCGGVLLGGNFSGPVVCVYYMMLVCELPADSYKSDFVFIIWEGFFDNLNRQIGVGFCLFAVHRGVGCACVLRHSGSMNSFSEGGKERGTYLVVAEKQNQTVFCFPRRPALFCQPRSPVWGFLFIFFCYQTARYDVCFLLAIGVA